MEAIDVKQATVDELTAGAEGLEAKLKALGTAEGTDEDLNKQALVIGETADRALKFTEDQKRHLEGPYREALTVIGEAWAPIVTRLKAIKAASKAFIADRIAKAQERARAEKAKADAALEEARKKADADKNSHESLAALRQAREAQETATAAAAASTTVRVGTASFSGKEAWTYEIIDEALVPVEWKKMVIDDAKVKEAIDKGAREIPGLRIYAQIAGRLRGKR